MSALFVNLLWASPVSAAGSEATDGVAAKAELMINNAGRTNDLAGLGIAEKLLQNGLTENSSDPVLLHYLGYEIYRETSPLDAKEARIRLKQGDDYLRQAEATGQFPETPALRAVILGRLTKADPRRAMTLGMESKRQIDLAIRLGAENPRVWLLRGIETLYEPAAAGGGAKLAEAYLRRSIELFSHDVAKPPLPNWGKEEAYCWLGQVLIQKKDFVGAEQAYRQALLIAPDYAWLKDELLPSLKRQESADEKANG